MSDLNKLSKHRTLKKNFEKEKNEKAPILELLGLVTIEKT